MARTLPPQAGRGGDQGPREGYHHLGGREQIALYKHPAVQIAAVVARPDSKWGETPCAFVQLKPGTQTTEDEIIAFCRDRPAHFKAPKSAVFGPLPTTATGKVQKFTLGERARNL